MKKTDSALETTSSIVLWHLLHVYNSKPTPHRKKRERLLMSKKHYLPNDSMQNNFDTKSMQKKIPEKDRCKIAFFTTINVKNHYKATADWMQIQRMKYITEEDLYRDIGKFRCNYSYSLSFSTKLCLWIQKIHLKKSPIYPFLVSDNFLCPFLPSFWWNIFL